MNNFLNSLSAGQILFGVALLSLLFLGIGCWIGELLIRLVNYSYDKRMNAQDEFEYKDEL